MRAALKTTWLVILAGFIWATNLPAQPLITTYQSGGTDSVVSIVADQQGLSLLSPDQMPVSGTFWLVEPSGATAPLPRLPSSSSYPVYAITDDGEFLVDASGGEVAVRAPAGQPVTSDMISYAVTAEAGALTDLINDIQETQFEGQMRTLSRAMGMADDNSADDDSGSSICPGGYSFDTNQLWLNISNVSNGTAYLNLFNATNQTGFNGGGVYAIWSTTNLLAGWSVETEVWPTDTNCQPFTIQTQDRQNLFLRAEDWTDVDSDGDGVPDWWAWEYWGTTNLMDANLDYSGNGNTFSQDYSNNVTPTVFTFTGLAVTNNYVNTSSVNVQLNVAGLPYYIAISIDDTNFQADAFWQPYSGSNMVVNLGMTEGWHNVCIGLRGHGDDPISAVWQSKRMKLDTTPPALFITNPTNTTVDIPMIQLQGFSPEALSSISYDLTNAAGLLTGQQILVLNQTYDTNSFEFTTNTFQAYDVTLTNGVNTFIFHATDLAGNTTTASYSVMLDYSAKTNPPNVQVTWPQNGTQVSGTSFTVDGQVADATITVAATITDNNGDTNTVNGLVERTGKFWVQNLPLNAGTNAVALAVTDAAGNMTTTNFNVIQSAVTLTVNPVMPASQLWQPIVNLTGAVSDASYAVWINGVKGHNNGNGTWSASNVPVNGGGTASFTVTGYAPNEQQPDGSYGN